MEEERFKGREREAGERSRNIVVRSGKETETSGLVLKKDAPYHAVGGYPVRGKSCLTQVPINSPPLPSEKPASFTAQLESVHGAPGPPENVNLVPVVFAPSK